VEWRSRRIRVVLVALSLLSSSILGSRDFRWALQELHGETAGRVPRDVAVHEPGTWVVGLKANNSVALASQHGSVTTRWAVEVEGANLARSEMTLALAEEREVVTVQVHWVGCEELVLDDEVDPLVGTLRDDRNVLSIQISCVGCGIGGLGELRESWQAGVNVHGVSVQVPAEDGSIVSGRNCAKLTSWESGSLGSESTGRACGLGDHGNQRCKRLILANTCNITRVEAGGRGWKTVRSTLVLDDTVCKTECSVVASRRASTLGGSTKEVRADGLIGLNDNIVALSKRDVNVVSRVWLDGNKVRG
jgi:hypothetical protein